jgi:hypothetical protein
MIDFETAKKIAIAHIGEWILIEKNTIEKPYGWCFNSLPQSAIDEGRCTFTSGPARFLVERENGRIIRFGSANSYQTWLKFYERGYFDRSTYILTILQIDDLSTTIKALLELNMSFVIPEIACGVEWHISQKYTAEVLQKLLSNLPCHFEGHKFWECGRIFDRIDRTRCCEYSLSKCEDEYPDWD